MRATLLGAIVTLVAAMPVSAQDMPPVVVVAHTGMTAPDLPGGTTLGFLSSSPRPVINDHGRIAFWYELWNSSVPELNGIESIWTFKDGTLEPVAVAGDPVPGIGIPGATLERFGRRVLVDDTGHIAFNGRWSDGVDDFRQGIWARQPDGSIRRIVTTGMAAPDTPPDHVFTSLGFPPNFFTYHDARFFLGGGRVAFRTDNVDDPDADTPLPGDLTGIWSERPTAFERELTVVARNGDDTTFGNNPILSGMNPLGQTVFYVTINPQDDPSYQSIWSENGNILLQVAKTGSKAGGDVTFESLGNKPGIRNGGPAAFTAHYSDLPGDEDSGVFKQQDQTASVVITEGAVAPDLPDESGDGVSDYVFEDFGGNDSSPLFNSNGTVAFSARAARPDGSNPTSGTWTDVDGGLTQLTLVVAEGQEAQAPGLPNGTIFDSTIPSGNWAHNDDNQIVFTAIVEAPDGTRANTLWLWKDGNLSLQLKAVINHSPGNEIDPQIIELPDGDALEVDFLAFAGGDDVVGSGNGDGRPSGFSDNGKIVALVCQGSKCAIVATNDLLFTDAFESP